LKLWSLLSLSASLDLWQSDGTADSVRDLSINVNHGLQTPTPPTRHQAWVLDTFDIKPPDNVLCVEFERMQIQFDFLEIRKKAKPIKKVKANAEQFAIEEEMLLDLAPSFKGHGNVDELAHAVARMGDLPTLISRCFEPKLEIWDELGIVQKSPLPYSTQQKDPPIAGLEKYIIEQNGKVSGSKNGRTRHPTATIEILNAWLQANRDNLHPSNTQTVEIMNRTGLGRGGSD
jgi:hypothetical protein